MKRFNERPHHWTLKTNHGWEDAIGVDEEDAAGRLFDSNRILSPARNLYIHIGFGIRGRWIDDSYWQWLQDRDRENEKIDKICSLCETSTQVIRVCNVIGFDVNKAWGYWATTPKKEQKKVNKTLEA